MARSLPRDLERVRTYLRDAGAASWARPDDEDYVAKVADRMAILRRENPGGDYPGFTHGQDDIGACAECDALKILQWGDE